MPAPRRILGLCLLAALLSACGAKDEKSAAAPGPTITPPERKGEEPAPLKEDVMDLAAFIDAFPMRGMPRELDLHRDFSTAEQLARYPHHQALRIRMPDGSLVEYPEQDFRCIALQTTPQGVRWILTLRHIGDGKLSYLSSFDPAMKRITVTEVARDQRLFTQDTRRWGHFPDQMNYIYTYTMREGSTLRDSIVGTLVFLENGQTKVIGEEKLQ